MSTPIYKKIGEDQRKLADKSGFRDKQHNGAVHQDGQPQSDHPK
jgi:hypothetical protein